MAVRVFLPDATQSGEQLALPADAGAHVTRVLRLAVGDEIRVFNGRGSEWQARVVTSSKTSVVVAVLAATAPARETRVRYTLALALLKGDGTDEAIRDVVMAGAAAVRPFVSARSEVSAVAAMRASRRERWQRVAVSAVAQSGRAVVPEVAAPVTFDTIMAAPADGVRLMLVEPAAGAGTVVLADVLAPAAVTLAIGPEGGWTAEEVARAAGAGWMLVGLGGRTLRATSAPLAAMAACQAVWRDD